MITSTITAWERGGIFPADYCQKLRLCYKNGCKGGLTFETRLFIQQSKKIGLYSAEYELLEPNFNIELDAEQASDEHLPSGFKKVDSWVDIHETFNNSDIRKSQITADYSKSPKQPDLAEENEDFCCDYITPEKLRDSYVTGIENNQNSDETDEDIDGMPLSIPRRIDEGISLKIG